MPKALHDLFTVKNMLRQGRNILLLEYLKISGEKAHGSPVILTGNQKSGTSVIASLLAEAVGERSTVDIFTRLGNYEERLLDGRVSFEDFLTKSNPLWSPKIVKEPEFVLFLPEIHKNFQGAKKVYIVRDPLTNIRSILSRLALSPDDCESMNLNEANFKEFPLWNLVFDKKRMPYKGDNGFEMLARRWAYVVEQIKQHVDGAVLVKYEDFLSNKMQFIQSLARDLEFDVIRDISSLTDKQFQPKGVATPIEDYFSRSQIAMIRSVCAPGMSWLGYE